MSAVGGAELARSWASTDHVAGKPSRRASAGPADGSRWSPAANASVRAQLHRELRRPPPEPVVAGLERPPEIGHRPVPLDPVLDRV